MNEILIVPDIHGRNFWKPALDFTGEIIFLGDYTDPYPQEGFTQKNALENLLQIVDFKRNNPQRVCLLIGNHELSYINKKFYASRFSSTYYKHYHAILTGKDTAKFFQICKMIDNYLFIHAGITKGWYDTHEKELQTSGECLDTQINNLFISDKSAFYEVSYRRGGPDIFGSPLWADIEELTSESEHFSDEIIQIIGHSQLRTTEPFVFDNIRLLDNRQLYILKNNNIEKYV
jgi:hypothetical protein